MTAEDVPSVPEVTLSDAAAEPADGPTVKLFTMEDLAKHASYKDCWMLIDGKVYDVTKFMDEHPGGDEVMLSSTGKDASEDFEDVGHSTSARQQLKSFLIGEIDPTSIPPPPIHTMKSTSVSMRQSVGTNKVLMTILQILVPIAILALAIAVRIITKKEPIPSL